MTQEENPSQRVTLAEYDDPPSNRDPAAAVAQARAATAQLRRRLGTLVQAHRNDEAWLSRRGHRLDTTGLYRLNTGDPARFLRYGERAAPATAVGLLLDRSGSMNHQIDLAGQAVLATALALEDLDGVSCWAAAFPGVYHHQIVPLKGFAERTRRVAGRFGLAAGGGTPLASALWRAGFELIRRPEPRRLLIVATDGQPNDVDAAHDILGRCRTSGIEVIGLGIGQSLTEVRAVFGDRDATAIEAITALAPALFALLEQRLAPAG
jgi:nitric oxide reductase activation protein